MKTTLLVVGIIAAALGTAVVPAGIAMAGEPSSFEFQLEQTESYRGLGVHGYVHNPLQWRITNVRVQVDSVDANGALLASASGWVQGDVSAGGRAYFYVPITAPAPAYRASVRSFDRVMIETPQAP